MIHPIRQSLVNPTIMNYLRGTPWIVWWLRAMGCRIGDYVFMGSLQITEFDLVEVGDHAIIGVDAVLQVRAPRIVFGCADPGDCDRCFVFDPTLP